MKQCVRCFGRRIIIFVDKGKPPPFLLGGGHLSYPNFEENPPHKSENGMVKSNWNQSANTY